MNIIRLSIYRFIDDGQIDERRHTGAARTGRRLRMIHSNIPKRPTVLAAVGLAVALVLSIALAPTPAFAAQPACKGQNKDSVECGGGGGGAPRDIPLCVTVLPTVDGIGITALDDSDNVFCDRAGGIHAGISAEGGVLDVALWAHPVSNRCVVLQ